MINNVYLQLVFVVFIPEELEENKLYISKRYSVAIHLCACGCKNKTVTPFGKPNIDDPEGKHCWTLTENEGKVTLRNSIGNHQLPCKSHYMITDNIANDC